ncbi:MAG: prenyltransferase/squalene oxidase repeat-containing protein [Bryobacteraceae bacterium]
MFLLKSQLSDGGWPAFLGDSEGSWTTALALCTLNSTGDFTAAREKAFRWLYAERGREGHWFWRWKFKTSDRNVRFDPDKYGWPWVTGSASWVIPTAFSIIAIEQFTVCNRSEESEKRIHLGVEMLLDRECVDGGWNSGNSLVYGVPLRPHVEATAIALLALQDEQRIEMVQKSLSWLRQNAASVDSVSSLAWCILTLFVYQESVEPLKNRLATIMGDGREVRNNATLATALLALKCGEMIHPFVVLR